ncbi:MAG: SLC45 family MFS transporter [Chloroflexi bacterium]|nr:MAG: SLC45 family MFS transporter [Chloroflexota bacterium]
MNLENTTGDISRARMLLYSAGSVGTGAFYAFNNFVLPPVLKSFGAPDLLIGFLSSTRSLEGALIQPTVGALSDRTWTRLGRRRPFILVAIPLSALFFLAAGSASSLVQLAVLIFLFSIFFNTAVDPYAALLPDIAPLHQRGLLSGLATATQLISSVALLLLVASGSGNGAVPAWTYDVVAAILVVSFGVTVLGVREQRERTEPAPTVERVPWRASLAAILVHRQAVRYLGTLFVYQFGLNAILPYLVLFITDEIHESQQTGLILSATLLLVMAISAVVFGRLADRIGTRLVLALGWALLAASAVAGVLITTLPQTVAVVLLAGVGNGAATAANWPLLTALIPPEKTGVFAGLKAAAESIAIPLSVVVAAELFLPRFGYRGIFAMLAINIVLALVLLLRFVRVPPAAEPLTAEPLAV